MTSLVAYYPHPDQPNDIDLLRTLLPPEIAICTSSTPPIKFHAVIGWDFDATLLDQHPEVRWLIQPYTGIDTKITAIAKRLPNISVHNTHINAKATAEFAIGLLFAVTKCIVPSDKALRRGDWLSYWNPSPHWQPVRSLQISGKRALVLGYGAIGQHVGRILTGLGVQVTGVKRSAEPDQTIDGVPVYAISQLHTLLPDADILMVCLPLTPETQGIIGSQELALMPSTGIVINVGRGAVINEQALYKALRDDLILGAGIDVWYRYPDSSAETPSVVCPSAYPFHQLDNVVMTPHRAGMLMDGEGDDSIPQAIAEILIAAASGEPVPNKVNIDAGY